MRASTVIALIFVLAVSAAAEECKQKGKKRLFDQDFGIAMTHEDYLAHMMMPWSFPNYFRSWRHMQGAERDFGSTIKTDKDHFEINLDVQHFSPNEIKVKTANGFVVVEAKHEEKRDQHGLISRQFVRKYSLPDGVESHQVTSQLSSDGILKVSAPIVPMKGGERMIPISRTGPVRQEPKEKEETCDKDTCTKP